MKENAMNVRISLLLTFLLLAASMRAQTPPAPAQVPKLVKFSGVLSDASGRPLTGLVGVTFSLNKDEQGGAPLWLEAQNVQANSNGHFSVMLGGQHAGMPE